MFASHSDFEFSAPPDPDRPGVRHWRMFELTLDAPWFLLSEESSDPNVAGLTRTQTLCIAWEYDLAEVLRSMDTSRVKALTCMWPAERPDEPRWASREVREVWLHSSALGRHVVLGDSAGNHFDCGLVPEHVGKVKVELLLRLPTSPAASRPR